MKFTVHYPVEQYGFLEAEFEADDLTVAAHNYHQIAEVFKSNSGIPEKEMNQIIDEYISTKKIENGQEAYEKMSDRQRDILQCLKRAFKRLEYNGKLYERKTS